MKIYDRIYIQYFDDDGEPQEDIHWCEDRQFDRDIEYTLATPQPIDTMPTGEWCGIYANKKWDVGIWSFTHQCYVNRTGAYIERPTHWLPLPPKPEND